MLSSRYGLLMEEEDSDDDNSSDSDNFETSQSNTKNRDSIQNNDKERKLSKTSWKDDNSSSDAIAIPSYEDLSLCRADEETVLNAVYGEDFTRQDGVWGCARLNIHIKPPDLSQEHIGSEVT